MKREDGLRVESLLSNTGLIGPSTGQSTLFDT